MGQRLYTAKEILEYCPKAPKDWIIRYCQPVKTKLLSQGVVNLYSLEHIYKIVSMRRIEVEKNHLLANTRKKMALRNIGYIEIGLKRLKEIEHNNI